VTDWVTLDVVKAIHDAQIAEHGGLIGIRDQNLLESALARPRQLEAFGDPPPDLAALAATLAFGIVRNHAFADGNKRTSTVVTRTFLLLNGHDIVADDVSRIAIWLRIAEGTISEDELAEWLRSKIAPAELES
jgi:death-on-curing protein